MAAPRLGVAVAVAVVVVAVPRQVVAVAAAVAPRLGAEVVEVEAVSRAAAVAAHQ